MWVISIKIIRFCLHNHKHCVSCYWIECEWLSMSFSLSQMIFSWSNNKKPALAQCTLGMNTLEPHSMCIRTLARSKHHFCHDALNGPVIKPRYALTHANLLLWIMQIILAFHTAKKKFHVFTDILSRKKQCFAVYFAICMHWFYAIHGCTEHGGLLKEIFVCTLAVCYITHTVDSVQKKKYFYRVLKRKKFAQSFPYNGTKGY